MCCWWTGSVLEARDILGAVETERKQAERWWSMGDRRGPPSAGGVAGAFWGTGASTLRKADAGVLMTLTLSFFSCEDDLR